MLVVNNEHLPSWFEFVKLIDFYGYSAEEVIQSILTMNVDNIQAALIPPNDPIKRHEWFLKQSKRQLLMDIHRVIRKIYPSFTIKYMKLSSDKLFVGIQLGV